jgi:hypothetical protein
MSEKINSSEALVVYLDLLGYKNTVLSENKSEFYFHAINGAIGRWRIFCEGKEENASLRKIINDNVSLEIVGDAFVVTLNLEKVQSIEGSSGNSLNTIIFLIFVNFISFLAQECICSTGHLLRGAIAKGQYYQNTFTDLSSSTFIFSKGLIEAYNLSEQIADVPRVLIDKTVLEIINIDTLANNRRPDRELLFDSDGLYYLNYYGYFFSNPDLSKILRNIATLIKEKIVKHNNNLRILRKYIWFSNYHNAYVKTILDSKAYVSCICLREIENDLSSILI